MAAITQPKPPGALSLLGMGPMGLDPDPRSDRLIDQAVGALSQGGDQNWKDEQLAFAGGFTDPSGNGSFGGGLTNAFAKQSEQRTKTKELQLQYLPTILNAITAQQSAKQAAMMTQAMMTPGGGDWIDKVSKRYNIAPEAIHVDLISNGGKGVREMIFKNSTPEYKLNDGTIIDVNPVTNGMYQPNGEGRMKPVQGVPGITTAATGASLARIPDPSVPGGFRVTAPPGSKEAMTGAASAAEEGKSEWDLHTVTPRGENPQLNTRKAFVEKLRGMQGAQGTQGAAGVQPPVSGQPPAVRGAFEGSPEKVLADIETLKTTNPAAYRQAMTAYANQMSGNNPPFAGGPGGGQQGAPQLADLEAAYTSAIDKKDAVQAAKIKTQIDQLRSGPPSMGMELQSPAEAKRLEHATDTESKNFAGNLGEVRKLKQSLANLNKAIEIMEQGKATASGAGVMADEAAAFFGKSLPGADAAAALKTYGGWNTSGVPRMEGPQSNFDVANYQQMAGMVGNDKLPMQTRLAAAKAARDALLNSAPKEFGSAFDPRDLPAPIHVPGVDKAPNPQQTGKVGATGMPTLEQIQAEIARRKGGK